MDCLSQLEPHVRAGSLRISLGSLVCWVADQGSYLGAVTEQLLGSELSCNVLSIGGENCQGAVLFVTSIMLCVIYRA